MFFLKKIFKQSAHRFGACREATPFDVRLQQRFQPRCIPIGVFDGIQNLSECMGLCLNQSECHVCFPQDLQKILIF